MEQQCTVKELQGTLLKKCFRIPCIKSLLIHQQVNCQRCLPAAGRGKGCVLSYSSSVELSQQHGRNLTELPWTIQATEWRLQQSRSPMHLEASQIAQSAFITKLMANPGLPRCLSQCGGRGGLDILKPDSGELTQGCMCSLHCAQRQGSRGPRHPTSIPGKAL